MDVITEIDIPDGKIRRCKSRNGDVIEHHKNDGSVESYNINDAEHRNRKNSFIKISRYTDGEVRLKYSINSFNIEICYYKSGRMKSKIYYNVKETEHHREDGPALTYYLDNVNNKIRLEYYCINGSKHREDGPAEVWYDKNNNNIIIEKYYINGSKHRYSKPAEIKYCECIVEFYVDGIQIENRTMYLYKIVKRKLFKKMRRLYRDELNSLYEQKEFEIVGDLNNLIAEYLY